MRAEPREAEYLAPLVKIIWPEHSLEDLAEIIREYMDSDESAVFAETANGQYVGIALCGLRHDYVEGCDTSPVGYLEGVSIHEYNGSSTGARNYLEIAKEVLRNA